MGNVFEFAEFELDVDAQQLRRAGQPVRTEVLILRLLETFVRSTGRLITKKELASEVWAGRTVSENALTVAIARLRKTLGEKRGSSNVSILTVHGRGYRFLPTVSTRDARSPTVACAAGGPIVGRERVMAGLRTAMTNARNGTGGMFVLCGEPGIGKTRIAELAARNAPELGLHVDWIYFRELGALPALWPFRGLLRNMLASSEVRSDPRVQALLPELACLLPDLAATDDLATSATPRVLDAIADTFALATEVRPRVIVLDDLQRADEASLELLNCLLPALPRMHILIVATVRSAAIDLADAPLTRLLSHRNGELVRLQPLTAPEVSSYLDALCGELDPAMHRAVHRISEGNPFFMVELGRQLRNYPEIDAATLAVPKVALELVRQRFADLPDETVSVLTHAAAIGRSFNLTLLRAVSELDNADLIAHLDEAVAKEILQRAPRSPSEFSFTHDLLRAALQAAQSPAECRALHLRVLEVLDENLSLSDVPISELAHHANCALPEGDLRKAVRYGIEAANTAARAGSFADATHYLQLARDAFDLMESTSILDTVPGYTPLPALRRTRLDALAGVQEGRVAESLARLQRMRR